MGKEDKLSAPTKHFPWGGGRKRALPWGGLSVQWSKEEHLKKKDGERKLWWWTALRGGER